MGFVKCPVCGSNKIYKSFLEKNYNLNINVCGNCYMIYQKVDKDINYYELECRTQKDYETHAFTRITIHLYCNNSMSSHTFNHTSQRSKVLQRFFNSFQTVDLNLIGSFDMF